MSLKVIEEDKSHNDDTNASNVSENDNMVDESSSDQSAEQNATITQP